MSVLLSHIDFAPLFYGFVMFLGIWSMWHKLRTWQLGAAAIEIGVFALVFILHGGTMAGGFAAMIAALLAGFFLTKRRNKETGQ